MTQLTVNITLLGAAPVLSLPTAAANGPTAYTGTVTTDAGGGTLWHVVTGSATQPSAAQIKTGLDHAGAAAAASGAHMPGAAGLQTVTGTGLTASSVYHIHYLHSKDGLDSNRVVSASFTTAALGTGSGTVAINLYDRSGLQVAPEGMFFEATVSDASVATNNYMTAYDPSFHDVTYVWSFGDVHAVSDKVVNVPVAHNNLNVGYGRTVGHTFTKPGTYTVTCDAYGPAGYIGRASMSVTVGNPDTLFAGNRTILLGPADPAYPGAQVVSTYAAARAALEALGQPGRILIQRGRTESTNADIWGGIHNVQNIYVGTYGTGARPVMTMTNTGAFGMYGGWNSFTGDIVLQGIDYRGLWNGENESGQRGPVLIYGEALDNTSIVVDDCLINGFSLPVYTPGAGGQSITSVNNTFITGWAEYAIFTFITGSTNVLCVTGTVMAHLPLQNSGGSGQIGVGNTQGCFRSNTGGRHYFDVVDMFSRAGWTPAGDGFYQCCVRFNTRLTDRASGVFTRCAMEGGWPVFASTESEGGSHSRVDSNLLIDKCLLVGSRHSDRLIDFETGGATVRNTIGVFPEMPTRSGYNGGNVQIRTTGGRPVSNPGAPLKVYSSSFIDNRPSNQATAANSVFFGDTAKLTAEQEANNVFQFDLQTGRELENANLNNTARMPTVGGVWTARYLGVKRAGVALQTNAATPPDSVKTYTPNAGSPVIGSAGGALVAHDDFFGAVRANADRGAVER